MEKQKRSADRAGAILVGRVIKRPAAAAAAADFCRSIGFSCIYGR